MVSVTRAHCHKLKRTILWDGVLGLFPTHPFVTLFVLPDFLFLFFGQKQLRSFRNYFVHERIEFELFH